MTAEETWALNRGFHSFLNRGGRYAWIMSESSYIFRGTREYVRANLALFCAGFVTFATLYDFQPLLPNLVHDFGVSPAAASLSISFATLAMACTLPFSGSLSDTVGRRIMMDVAVILASILAFVTACCDSLPPMLALRLIQGIALAGVPAVAMAYLSEEIDPRSLGSAMGLYIAGNALGGMTGRILTACLADYMPWRTALALLAFLSLVLGILFLVLLPPSRNFIRRPFTVRQLAASLLDHVKNPRLLCLFGVGFFCMGSFVTLYNYITFRLVGPAFDLSQTQVALIFFAYVLGGWSSSFMGGLSSRFGRSRILGMALAVMTAGVLLTMDDRLIPVIFGIVVFTVGFFGAHSVASSWVGVLADHTRAQASSLYLFSYYMGSSISGTMGGFLYTAWGWMGVSLLLLLLIVGAGLASRWLMVLTRRQTEKISCSQDAVCVVERRHS